MEMARLGKKQLNYRFLNKQRDASRANPPPAIVTVAAPIKHSIKKGPVVENRNYGN